MSRLGRRARSGALGACAIVVVLIAGCGAQPPGEAVQSPEPGRSASTPDATQPTPDEGRGDLIDEASGPTTEVVSMTDPVQDAFTVNVPAGWDSVAYTDGSIGVWRYIVNSVSPDGATVLYSGDPKMPQFWNPDQAHETIRAFADYLEHMKIEYYEPASFYFPAYVQRRFGALPGFDLHTVEYDAEGVQLLQDAFAQSSLQPLDIDASRVYFDYTADGAPMHGVVVGYTIDSGAFWQADVYGLSTSGAVEDYLPMATAIAHSVRIKPEWTAKQQQNHEQQMAQIEAFGRKMTSQHNANMAAIQASADRHQQRMQAIWSANDASIQSFNDRMASGDVQQRNFLNYINDEETVSGSGGQTWQVQTGFQRYWMNPTTNQYVGGDINFDDDDLRARGLNPNDYQEVKVRG